MIQISIVAQISQRLTSHLQFFLLLIQQSSASLNLLVSILTIFSHLQFITFKLMLTSQFTQFRFNKSSLLIHQSSQTTSKVLNSTASSNNNLFILCSLHSGNKTLQQVFLQSHQHLIIIRYLLWRVISHLSNSQKIMKTRTIRLQRKKHLRSIKLNSQDLTRLFKIKLGPTSWTEWQKELNLSNMNQNKTLNQVCTTVKLIVIYERWK